MMTKILETGWDHEHTKAENLSMDELAEANIAPIDTEPCADRWPNVTLNVTTRHPPDDYFQVGSIDIVSDRIKEVMNGLNVEAEFLPLKVLHKGRVCSGRRFYFCHLLKQVDCFDHLSGQCTFHDDPRFANRIDEIQAMSIDEGKADGHHLFRLAKGAEFIICVSDELAQLLVGAGVTGARFVVPSEWR